MAKVKSKGTKLKVDDKGRVKLLTPVVRASFPRVYKPHDRGYDEGKYTIDLLFEDKDEAKTLKLAIKKVAENKWGGNTKLGKPGQEGDRKGKIVQIPLKDGDEKTDKNDNLLDGYSGNYYVTAKSNRKPGIVGPDKQPLDPEKVKIEGGDYVMAAITVLPYEQGKKKGISIALNNLLYVKEGEKFGEGGSDPEEDFADIDTSEYLEGDEEAEVDEDEEFEEEEEEDEDDIV